MGKKSLRDDYYSRDPGPSFFSGLVTEIERKPKPKAARSTAKGPSLGSLVPSELKQSLGLAVMIAIMLMLAFLVLMLKPF